MREGEFMLAPGSLVTVFGGSGFVGRHLVRLLAREGFRVRAAERRPDLAGHLQPMGGPGQIMAIQANVRDAASVARALEGASGAVNLTSAYTNSGRQNFQAVNVRGARSVADAARKAGATAFVQMSGLGAVPKSPSAYARSRAAGEAEVRQGMPSAVILRPSVIFGPEDQLFNRFAALAARLPIMPVIGAKTRLQPVYVGDVAAAILAALTGHAKPGAIYELGGPDVLTMSQLVSRAMEYSGHVRSKEALPDWLAKTMAALTKPLPMALRPFTVDQVRLLQVDNVVSKEAIDEGRTLGGLGIAAPQTIAAVVPGYLERFRPNGQYSHYRG